VGNTIEKKTSVKAHKDHARRLARVVISGAGRRVRRRMMKKNQGLHTAARNALGMVSGMGKFKAFGRGARSFKGGGGGGGGGN